MCNDLKCVCIKTILYVNFCFCHLPKCIVICLFKNKMYVCNLCFDLLKFNYEKTVNKF